MSFALRQYLGVAAVSAAIICSGAVATSQALRGEIGHDYGADWCAARVDLSRVTTFPAGTRLCLSLRGGPEFLLRLKPFGDDPDLDAQIIGSVREVPKSGRLEITLEGEHRHIDQISVHACRRAWDTEFRLGNGDIRLDAISVLTGRWTCK